jgi:hypothetical protein
VSVHDGIPEPYRIRSEVVAVQERELTFRIYLPDGRVLTALDMHHARRLIFTYAPGAHVRWEQAA